MIVSECLGVMPYRCCVSELNWEWGRLVVLMGMRQRVHTHRPPPTYLRQPQKRAKNGSRKTGFGVAR